MSTMLRGARCVLIHLCRHYENHPSGFEFNSVSTCLAGLGIGLLATAAVALSPTLADLPFAGAEVVRLAFRLGVLVDEVSQNLQPRDLTGQGGLDSWAYVIPDVAADDVQKELDAIHAREVSLNRPLSHTPLSESNQNARKHLKPVRYSLAHSVERQSP